jgi:Lon protease-like protein
LCCISPLSCRRRQLGNSPADKSSDAHLVALARRGDKDAFGRLSDRYRALAERVARRTVANEDLAQELAQEAMVQAYLSLDHLREAASFKNESTEKTTEARRAQRKTKVSLRKSCAKLTIGQKSCLQM